MNIRFTSRLSSQVRKKVIIHLWHNNIVYNHNYNEIVKSDWLSTALISALIGKLLGQYASCLSNWTVRAITRALNFASKAKFRISCVLI